MKIWERATEIIADVFWHRQIKRIDDSGERVAMFIVPVGGSIIWDDDLLVPDGWLRCDGTTYEQQRYRTLYNVISNLYGGTPGETFMVPVAPDTIILAGKGG